MSDTIDCIYCKSDRITRHGKSPIGKTRMRCRDCGRTWVLVYDNEKTDIGDLAQDYLLGSTYRDLADMYKSSPRRINQKLRDYLKGFPHWENYIDSLMNTHHPKQIILAGKSFACSVRGNDKNTMFSIFAIDALSGFVLAYDVANEDTSVVWDKMLHRMSRRNIKCDSFMSNGTEAVLKSVMKYYPNADNKILFHRNSREKELACCVMRIPVNYKLMNEAARIMVSLDNKTVLEQLGINDYRQLMDYFISHQNEFTEKLRQKLETKPIHKNDALIVKFQERFDKFYMLKEDPEPIINAWIANTMLYKNGYTYNSFTLYSQKLIEMDLKHYATGVIPNGSSNFRDEGESKNFLLDIAVRALELPVLTHDCGLLYENCFLM